MSLLERVEELLVPWIINSMFKQPKSCLDPSWLRRTTPPPVTEDPGSFFCSQPDAFIMLNCHHRESR